LNGIAADIMANVSDGSNDVSATALRAKDETVIFVGEVKFRLRRSHNHLALSNELTTKARDAIRQSQALLDNMHIRSLYRG